VIRFAVAAQPEPPVASTTPLTLLEPFPEASWGRCSVAAMPRRTVPGITLRRDGAPAALETLISPVSPYVVCLSCAAPAYAVGLHAAYVGDESAEHTAIARVVMGFTNTTTQALTCSTAELPLSHARERLLLHLAAFRELLAGNASNISIDIDDRALAVASATY